MSKADPTPYEVGHKRPPKATRWRPGQSGNPKGRPKGSVNKRTLLERLLRDASDLAWIRAQKEQLDAAGLTQYGIKPKPRRR